MNSKNRGGVKAPSAEALANVTPPEALAPVAGTTATDDKTVTIDGTAPADGDVSDPKTPPSAAASGAGANQIGVTKATPELPATVAALAPMTIKAPALGSTVIVSPRQRVQGSEDYVGIVLGYPAKSPDCPIHATLFAVGQAPRAITAGIPHRSAPNPRSQYVWRYADETRG